MFTHWSSLSGWRLLVLHITSLTSSFFTHGHVPSEFPVLTLPPLQCTVIMQKDTLSLCQPFLGFQGLHHALQTKTKLISSFPKYPLSSARFCPTALAYWCFSNTQTCGFALNHLTYSLHHFKTGSLLSDLHLFIFSAERLPLTSSPITPLFWYLIWYDLFWFPVLPQICYLASILIWYFPCPSVCLMPVSFHWNIPSYGELLPDISPLFSHCIEQYKAYNRYGINTWLMAEEGRRSMDSVDSYSCYDKDV